jgi:hypothetical protein
VNFINVSLLIFLLTSCSTIEFVQNGKQEFSISSITGSENFIQIEDEVPFYFWGIMPDMATVDFDKIFFDKGVHNPSMVKVERIRTFKSTLYSLLTLGLYLPEPYRVTVFSKGEEH